MRYNSQDMYECDVFIVSYIPDGFEKKYYVIKNKYTSTIGIVTEEEFIDLLRVSKRSIVVSLELFEQGTKNDFMDKIRRAEMEDLIRR